MRKTNEMNDSNRPSDQAIAKRAYELYLQRGSTPGYELHDWLEAEAQLIAEASNDRQTELSGQASARDGTGASTRGTSRRRNASSGSGNRRAARP
jgi:hypothetical protein